MLWDDPPDQFLLLDNKTNINNKNEIKNIKLSKKKNLGPSKPYEVPVHRIKS